MDQHTPGDPYSRVVRISIQGNIAAGKSSYLDKIKESSEFVILRIPEPVDLWNFTNTHCKSFFEEFLMDHQKGGVNLQLLIFSSYLQTEMDIVEQIKTLRQAGEVRYIILLQERDIDAGLDIFVEGANHFSPMDKAILTEYALSIRSRIQRPDKVIYLDVDPKTCLERCIRRSRSLESKYDLKYFIKIDKSYHKLCAYWSGLGQLTSIKDNMDVELPLKIARLEIARRVQDKLFRGLICVEEVEEQIVEPTTDEDKLEKQPQVAETGARKKKNKKKKKKCRKEQDQEAMITTRCGKTTTRVCLCVICSSSKKEYVEALEELGSEPSCDDGGEDDPWTRAGKRLLERIQERKHKEDIL